MTLEKIAEFYASVCDAKAATLYDHAKPPYKDCAQAIRTAILPPELVAEIERTENMRKALAPFAALGGPDDGCAVAFPDLPDDTVIYKNSGKWITAGHVRAARKLMSDFYQPHAAIAGKESGHDA